MKEFHIGQVLKDIIERKKGGLKLTYEDIAQSIGRSRVNLYRMIKTGYVDVNTLVKLSRILEYNFFQHFLDENDIQDLLNLHPEFGKDKLEQLEKLKKANGYLALENSYLKKIVQLQEENNRA